MFFLRNRFIQRAISSLLLLVFVQSLILPDYAYALTGEVHQPEYTSYEDAGSTDMVNLLTGDFGFSFPVLEVPGPEGGFTLPMSYHAGIGPEQEASWVGLGWNINAGAIVRDINQFPDDANKDVQTVTVQDLTGIRGWQRIFNHPYKDDWNSKTGHHGNVNLLDIVEVDFGSYSSVGIMGVHVGDGGLSFDPVQFGMAAYNVISIVGGGAGAAASMAKQAAIDMAIQTAVSFAMPVNTPQASASGYWSSTTKTGKTSLEFHLRESLLTGIPIGSKKKPYHVYIDETRTEDMYGILYLANPLKLPYNNSVNDDTYSKKVNGSLFLPMDYFSPPTNSVNHGSASDINFITDSSPYEQTKTPTTLATDAYAVNAPGISGSISPYRLEVGSVSMPREMTENHIRFAPFPYASNYKVPFIYNGTNSNRFFDHVGSASTSTPQAPQFYFGLDYETAARCQGAECSGTAHKFIFNDYVLNLVPGPTSTKLPQRSFIEWLSNEEIKNSTTYPSGFVDFIPASERINFRKTDNANHTSSGIGGFAITSPDGTSYHFALPVFDFDSRTEVIDVNDNNKRSIISREKSFANTWLLTAITGSDFIDRNQNGLADDEDWGYWIKFNYGKWLDNYSFRMPLQGELLDPTGQYKSYEQGKKQLYYLNSIETRSHVALFIKSQREDGKDIDGQPGLKLNEISLLKKETYKRLHAAPYYSPDYSNQISHHCLDTDFSLAATEFINRNCVKRVVFSYGYDLCKNTPNASGANNAQKAKLTLKRMGIKGRNDISILPDYKFEYGNANPDYNPHYWDGWGMYKPFGNSFPYSHKTDDPTGAHGAAWSLSRITTPVGAEIVVGYERDTYSSISGEMVLGTSDAYYQTDFPLPGYYEIPVPNTFEYNTGDKVWLDGEFTYICPEDFSYHTKVYDGIYNVVEVSATGITVDLDYHHLATQNAECAGGGTIMVDNNRGTVGRIVPAKTGGNLRTASILLKDEFGKVKKLRYLYSKDDGTSSGVVSQEPEYIREKNFPFYNYLKYPQTPVMYGQVSVLSGPLTTDNDYFSKQVFEFETPHHSMLTFTAEDKGSTTNAQKYFYTFSDRTSRIGNLKSVKIMDRSNNVVSQSELCYTEELSNNGVNNFQGVFSEGTLLTERANGRIKLTRTTVIEHPYVLKKITNTKDGVSSFSENLSWDLLTGFVDQKLDKSSLGVYVKTVTTPAYKVYLQLGSKADGYSLSGGKNMLMQNAATYFFRSDASGASFGLISAEAQVWRKDWANYRYLTPNGYVDDNDAPYYPHYNTHWVWRKGPTYVWKGDYTRLQADGTQMFSPADAFDFSNVANNPLWQYTGEILRFDHYGMPLEVKDMNGIYSTTKMGYKDREVIAAASNASYNEIAFSSAEDLIEGRPYFGGEVGLGNGIVKYLSKGETTITHTGDAVVSVPTWVERSFVFKTSGKANKRYRASVWTNSLHGRIYYRVNGGSDVLSSAPSAAKLVNGWYLVDIDVPVETADFQLEVGVKSVDGPVLFDDFRFQPSDALMTCFVYLPDNFEYQSGQQSTYSWVLNNDNFYTKFESNERGSHIKTYQESFKYGVKLVKEDKHNFRRFHINQ